MVRTPTPPPQPRRLQVSPVLTAVVLARPHPVCQAYGALSSRAAAGKVDANARKYAHWIGVGLLLCSVGDVCLDLEVLNPLFFLAGLGAFLVGHIMYIYAFAVGHPLVVCPMHGLPFYLCASHVPCAVECVAVVAVVGVT